MSETDAPKWVDLFGAAPTMTEAQFLGTVDEYADVHSVLCWAHRRPHDHGCGCHSTCPTCHGTAYTPPASPDQNGGV